MVAKLSQQIQSFFEDYADPRYDLWRGGVAKGSVVRPGMFKNLYGESWTTVTRILPAFEE